MVVGCIGVLEDARRTIRDIWAIAVCPENPEEERIAGMAADAVKDGAVAPDAAIPR